MVEVIVLTGVLWLVVMFVAVPFLTTIGAVVGDLISPSSLYKEGGGVIGGLIGWIVGGFLAVYSLVQVILHIIDLVKVLT